MTKVIPRTAWVKGQSGNPSGRRRIVGDVREAARKYTTEAIETLAKIMRDAKQPGAARAAAANALLDRGYGRPAQVVDATITQKPMEEMSDAELIRIAAGADDEAPKLVN
jgi:hypothetical protein